MNKPGALTAADLTWETVDGETYGYHDPSDAEITITGRVAPCAGVTVGTNVRGWRVSDARNETLATGQAEGLRNAKRDALHALDGHLARLAGPVA